MPLLMATSVFGLGRRCYSSPIWCYLHSLCTIFQVNINAVEIDLRSKTKVKTADLCCAVYIAQ